MSNLLLPSMESSEIQQLIGSLVLKRHRLVLDFRAAEEDFSAASEKWYADEKILKQDLRDKDVLIAELTAKLHYAIKAGFDSTAAFEYDYALASTKVVSTPKKKK